MTFLRRDVLKRALHSAGINDARNGAVIAIHIVVVVSYVLLLCAVNCRLRAVFPSRKTSSHESRPARP